jgi:hypothetical protein
LALADIRQRIADIQRPSLSGTLSAPLDQVLWLQACALNLWNPKQAAKNNGPPTVHCVQVYPRRFSVDQWKPGDLVPGFGGSFKPMVYFLDVTRKSIVAQGAWAVIQDQV